MSTRYIALATIHKTVEAGEAKTLLSAGKRPVIKEVAPGTILAMDDDDPDLKDLLSMSAIRKFTKEDAKGVPETLSSLSPEQQQMAAQDQADLARLRAEEATRLAEAAAQNNGGSTNDQVNPVDGLKTHADLDKYLADKKYTIEGWGADGLKTVAEKQGALKVADQNAAAAAALV